MPASKQPTAPAFAPDDQKQPIGPAFTPEDQGEAPAPQVDEDCDLIGPDGYTDADHPDEDNPDLSTPYWLERFR